MYSSGGMGSDAPWGEAAVGPVHPAMEEVVSLSGREREGRARQQAHQPLHSPPSTHLPQITIARFSHEEELLWTGTESGCVYGTSIPTLERYCAARVGAGRVAALAPLGDAVAAASTAALTVHAAGGRTAYAEVDPEAGYLCLAALPILGGGATVVAGRGEFSLVALDAATGTLITTDGAPSGASALAPAPLGALAVGTPEGRLLLIDPRAGWHSIADVSAGSGAVLAADGARDLLIASCASPRGDAVDPLVRVFDVRALPRALGPIQFTPRAVDVRFVPHLYGTALLAGAAGVLALADAAGGTAGTMLRVETGGLPLTTADVSASGALLAAASAGGYIHLWARDATHAVVAGLAPPPTPPPRSISASSSAPRVGDTSPLGAALTPTYAAAALDPHPDPSPFLSDGSGGDLDDWCAPPRAIDRGLLARVRYDGFLGVAPNPAAPPHGAPRGAGVAGSYALRSARLKVKASRGAAARALDRGRAAAAARSGGGSTRRDARAPPPLYDARAITAPDAGSRYAEFDSAAANPTRYGGLENGVANCYANAVVAALFYVPPLASTLAASPPDVGAEFSLLDECGALFRMLAAAPRGACQASNLLRALRASREAAALGLVEGHAQRAAGGADIEVEASKDASLARRVQSLVRFVLEQVHREAAARGLVVAGGVGDGATPPPSTTTTPPSPPAARPAPAATTVNAPSIVASTFGVPFVTTTRLALPASASAPPRTQTREGRSFCVELAYPLAKARPEPWWETAGRGSAAAAAAAVGGPSFADLLAASLRADVCARAWFDADVGYAPVTSTRVPTALPPYLVVCAGLHDRGDLAWWAPKVDAALAAAAADAAARAAAAPGDAAAAEAAVAAVAASRAAEVPWLPAAVRVECGGEGGVRVTPGKSGAALDAAADASTPSPVAASYDLVAVLAHVLDPRPPRAPADGDDDDDDGDDDDEGHLVTHVRVPMSYLDPECGIYASKAGEGRREEEEEGGEKGGGAAAVTPASPSKPAPSTLPTWILVNDFAISPTDAREPRRLYGPAKAPAVLVFASTAASVSPPQPPPPVQRALMGDAAFAALCGATPPPAAPAGPPPFVPFSVDEPPLKGRLLGLDAEFVALAPALRERRAGLDTEIRPARLGLARVSVVRGDGPNAGTPAIDDYVRQVEPVHDFLTRWSGLTAADLDPRASRRPLTTAKRAVTKLAHLVAAGAVFVGHGLAQDFRMINIVVPQSQVVDTVDLFRKPGARKLSLRFLAARLLASDIQVDVHDSVEDARAALALHEKYRELEAAGELGATLDALYEYGQVHGFGVGGDKGGPGGGGGEFGVGAAAHTV